MTCFTAYKMRYNSRHVVATQVSLAGIEVTAAMRRTPSSTIEFASAAMTPIYHGTHFAVKDIVCYLQFRNSKLAQLVNSVGASRVA